MADPQEPQQPSETPLVPVAAVRTRAKGTPDLDEIVLYSAPSAFFLWIVLLVCVVAVGAYLLGERARPGAAAPAAPVAAAPVPAAAPARSEADTSALPSSQPVRTFRGPDGMPHIIVYDPAKLPDNNDPQQVRAALLEDMKNHPTNIERAYDLTPAQIAEIVAGKRAIPDVMLPKPGKTAP